MQHWSWPKLLVILQTGRSSSLLCWPLPHSCFGACAPVGQPSPSEALHSRSAGLEREQWCSHRLHLFPGGSAVSSLFSLCVSCRLCSLQSCGQQPCFLWPVFSMLLTSPSPHAVSAEFVARLTSKA